MGNRTLREYLRANSLEDALLLFVLALAAVLLLRAPIGSHANVVDNAVQVSFSTALNKDVYLLGEDVRITAQPEEAQYSVSMMDPDGNFQQLHALSFQPTKTGTYTLNILLYIGEVTQRFTETFEVVALDRASQEQLAAVAEETPVLNDIPTEQPTIAVDQPVLPLDIPLQQLDLLLPNTSLNESPAPLENLTENNTVENLTPSAPLNGSAGNTSVTSETMLPAIPFISESAWQSLDVPEKIKGDKRKGKSKAERKPEGGVSFAVDDPQSNPEAYYWEDDRGNLDSYLLEQAGDEYRVKMKHRKGGAEYRIIDGGMQLKLAGETLVDRAVYLPQEFVDEVWRAIPLLDAAQTATAERDAATITVVRQCATGDCTFTETHQIGFDGVRYVQKTTVRLESNAPGWGLIPHRVVWDIHGLGADDTATPPTVKQYRVGDVIVDFSDYAGPTAFQKLPDQGILRVVFEPNGKTGNLDIDPGLVILPPGTKITIASTQFFQTWNITFDSTKGGIATILTMPAGEVYVDQPTEGNVFFRDIFQPTPSAQITDNWTRTNVTATGAAWNISTLADFAPGDAPGRARTTASAACTDTSGGCVMGLKTNVDTSSAIIVWVNFTIQADNLDSGEYVRAFVRNSSNLWESIFDFTSSGAGSDFANAIRSWNSSNLARFHHTTFNLSFACGASAATEPCMVDNVSISMVLPSNNLLSIVANHEGMDGMRAAYDGGGGSICWAGQQRDTGANLTLLENSTMRMKISGSANFYGTGETHTVGGVTCGQFNGVDGGDINWTSTIFPDRIVMNKTYTPQVTNLLEDIRSVTFNFRAISDIGSNVGRNITFFNDTTVRFDSDINGSTGINNFVYVLHPEFNRNVGQFVYKNHSNAIIAMAMLNQSLGNNLERWERFGTDIIELGPTEDTTDVNAGTQQNFTVVFFFDNKTFWVNDSLHMRDRFYDLYHPDSLEVIDGTLNTTTGGDRNLDGFDEQTSCYMLEARHNRTIFNLTAGPLASVVLGGPIINVTRFWPCFEVRSYRNLTFPFVEKVNLSGRFVLMAGTDYLLDFRSNNSANQQLVYWANEYISNETQYLIGADIWTPVVENTSRLSNGTDAAQGTPVTISTSARDERNTQIDVVRMNVTNPLGTQTSNINMSPVVGSNNWTSVFNATSEAGTYNISIFANDTTDMVNNTATGQFIIRDLVFPNVSYINSTGGTLNQGTSTNISTNVTDNTQLDRVIASITYPSGTLGNITMLNATFAGNTTQTPTNFSIKFNDTSATGVYVIRILANDTSNNLNDTVTARFTVVVSDTANPNVSYLWPLNGTNVTRHTPINLSANVTDDNTLDDVFFNITYPNTSQLALRALNASPNNFTMLFNDTTQSGNYTWRVQANDTSGNMNNTLSGQFAVQDCFCLLDNGGTETTTCTIRHVVCVSDMNITVASGGNLTIINSTLMMNTTNATQIVITVQASGELNIRNTSNITNGGSPNTMNAFFFKTYSGSTFSMTDSHLAWCGAAGGNLENTALTFFAAPIDFRNNSITQSTNGIIILGNEVVVTDSRLSGINASGTVFRTRNITGVDLNGNRGGGTNFLVIEQHLNDSFVRNNIATTTTRFIAGSSEDVQNLTIVNNTYTTTSFLINERIEFSKINDSKILHNVIRVNDAGVSVDPGIQITGNYTLIDNNTLNSPRTAGPQPGTMFALTLSGVSNTVSNNTITWAAGVFLVAAAENSTVVNNTITYTNHTGILIRGIGINITNNTIRANPGNIDLNLTTSSTGATVWNNHFLSYGVDDDGAGNTFCIGGAGNFYNESIGPDRIVLDNGDCGLINLTGIENKIFYGLLTVNWTNQSHSAVNLTYNIHHANGTLLNTTTDTRITLNTSFFHDGQHFLRIVPNITRAGSRYNGTNNQSLNFTIDNNCGCLLDNGGNETTQCIVVDKVCTTNTNITIFSGGNTTLINTTLRMNNTLQGAISLEVRPGGELHILNQSNITNGDIELQYLFKIFPSATFRITDSHVRHFGNFTPEGVHDDLNYIGGLQIGAKPIDLRNNNFSYSHDGLTLLVNDVRIEHNSFFFMNITAIWSVNTSGLHVLDNTAYNLSVTFFDSAANHSLFRGNNITVEYYGMQVLSINTTIENNYFETIESLGLGIGTIDTSTFAGPSATRHIIQNNTIRQRKSINTGGGIIASGGNARIVNNTILQNSILNTTAIAISVGGGGNHFIATNFINYSSGIQVGGTTENATVFNNTIRYSNRTGILIGGTHVNITNNTIQALSDRSVRDIELQTSASNNTIWRNHLLTNGISDSGANNNFCVLSEGNFYNESIGPDRIVLDNTDCGITNLTNGLDGQTFSGSIVVNWSKQSTFYSVFNTGLTNVTYNLFLDNTTLITSTQELNYTWDTTEHPDGVHQLRLVPNITQFGMRFNATNNLTEQFTLTNPCAFVGVFNITPIQGMGFNRTAVINISTNVLHAKNIDDVFANITYPNSSQIIFRLFNVTATNFTGLFNDTNHQFGNYSIRIQANATCGGRNDTEISYVNVGECNYNGTGQWTIGTSIQNTCENKDIMVNGNVTIAKGGNFTIINTTLRINSTYSGQYGVNDSGSFVVRNTSNITNGIDSHHRITFQVFSAEVTPPLNANFTLTDSFVSKVGWVRSVPGRQGIEIKSPNAVIRKNVFTQNWISLVFAANPGVSYNLLPVMENIFNYTFNTSNTSVIIDLTISNNRDINITNNTFFGGYDSAISGGPIIEMNRVKNIFIERNAIYSNSGSSNSIVCTSQAPHCANISIRNNLIYTNQTGLSPGMSLVNSTISGNLFNGSGLTLGQGTGGGANLTVVTNNTFITDSSAGLTLKIANYNNITGNTFFVRGSGNPAIVLDEADNNSFWNNSIFVAGDEGILFIGGSDQNNLTNNTINGTGIRDVAFGKTGSSGNGTLNNFWLNHFLRNGVNYTGTGTGGATAGNTFCAGGKGNFYQETILPRFIALNNSDCGITNLTNGLDGQTFSGSIVVNWSSQSTFYSVGGDGLTNITYMLFLDNVTLITTTQELNYTWDTSDAENGQHFLRIVPNITFSGARLNATVNLSENFTLNNPCFAVGVFNLTPLNGTGFNRSEVINISTNVLHTRNIDDVFANVTYPNTSQILMRLFNVTATNFTGLFNDTNNQYGMYRFRIQANATCSGLNNSEEGFVSVGDCRYNGTGHWNIGDRRICENKDIIVSGNITISTTGDLTLLNTTIRMNGSIDGSVGISFANKLNISIGSNITAVNGRYAFHEIAGSLVGFKINDSAVSYAGWTDESGRSGIEIRTAGALLRNNRFSNNYGILLETNSITVINNTIRDTNHTALNNQGKGGIITNNTIQNVFNSTHGYGIKAFHFGSSVLIIQNNTIANVSGVAIWANASIVVQNNVLRDNGRTGSVSIFLGNYSATETTPPNITNNWLNDSAPAGIIVDSNMNVLVVNNTIFGRSPNFIGITVSNSSFNVTLANNTIRTNISIGIRVNNSRFTNITGNIVKDSAVRDLELQGEFLASLFTMNTSVWLNHFLSMGVNDTVITGNNYCIDLTFTNTFKGNLYNESIPPSFMGRLDCGPANITDMLDGKTDLMQNLTVNWTNQSTFLEILTYNIHEGNGTLLGTSIGSNFTFNTTMFHDGSHRLSLVPNLTFPNARVNATVNFSQNFTTNNYPPFCLNVNTFGEDTDGSPFYTNNRTPSFNCTLDEIGNCRMSLTDESFTDMSDNIDCTGDSSNTTFCLTPTDLSIGVTSLYLACNNTFGNNASAINNLNFTLIVLPVATCRLSDDFRGLEFGNMYEDTNDTIDDAPRPLLLQNNGTVMLNVSFNASHVWTNQLNPSDFFTYLIEDNETSSYSAAQDNLPFKQFPATRYGFITAVTNLKYVNSTNTNNAVEIEVNVTAPVGEPHGQKTGMIEILCMSNEIPPHY